MFYFSQIQISISLAMLIWMLLFTPHAQPQTAPTSASPTAITTGSPLESKVKELEKDAKFSALEKAIMSEQLALKDLETVRAKKNEAYADVCKDAGLPVDANVCGIDFQSRKAVKRETTPAVPAKQ